MNKMTDDDATAKGFELLERFIVVCERIATVLEKNVPLLIPVDKEDYNADSQG